MYPRKLLKINHINLFLSKRKKLYFIYLQLFLGKFHELIILLIHFHTFVKKNLIRKIYILIPLPLMYDVNP